MGDLNVDKNAELTPDGDDAARDVWEKGMEKIDIDGL